LRIVFNSDDRVVEALARAVSASVDGEQILVQARQDHWILVSATVLREYVDEGKGDLALGSVLGLATPLPVVHPDQSLDVALRRLGDRPFLPVVHRAEAGRLVGVVGIQDILSAYRKR
jgi:CBS domain-containing protein